MRLYTFATTTTLTIVASTSSVKQPWVTSVRSILPQVRSILLPGEIYPALISQSWHVSGLSCAAYAVQVATGHHQPTHAAVRARCLMALPVISSLVDWLGFCCVLADGAAEPAHTAVCILVVSRYWSDCLSGSWHVSCLVIVQVCFLVCLHRVINVLVCLYLQERIMTHKHTQTHTRTRTRTHTLPSVRRHGICC